MAPSGTLQPPSAALCRHFAAKTAQCRRIEKWSDFYETHHFYTEFRVESDGDVHFDKKKCFTPSRMRFYIACSACSSQWDKLQTPPKPPKCRHQVDICADQLLLWWCITGPKGKSVGPPYHMIRQGGLYNPPYPDHAWLRRRPTKGKIIFPNYLLKLIVL